MEMGMTTTAFRIWVGLNYTHFQGVPRLAWLVLLPSPPAPDVQDSASPPTSSSAPVQKCPH